MRILAANATLLAEQLEDREADDEEYKKNGQTITLTGLKAYEGAWATVKGVSKTGKVLWVALEDAHSNKKAMRIWAENVVVGSAKHALKPTLSYGQGNQTQRPLAANSYALTTRMSSAISSYGSATFEYMISAN